MKYKKIRGLIAEGNVSEAIETLTTEVEGSNISEKNEVILQSSRLNNILKEKRIGVVSGEESKLTINQVIYGILALIDDLEKRYPERVDVNYDLDYIQNRFSIDRKIFNVLIISQKLREENKNGLIPLNLLIPYLESLFERMTFKGEPKIEMCTKQRWVERVHSAHLTYEALLIFEDDFRRQGTNEQIVIYNELLITISKYVDRMLLGLFKDNVNLDEVNDLIGTPEFASKLKGIEKNDFPLNEIGDKILIEDKFKKPINANLKKSILAIEKLLKTVKLT